MMLVCERDRVDDCVEGGQGGLVFGGGLGVFGIWCWSTVRHCVGNELHVVALR